MTRRARLMTWLHPDDCVPPHGLNLVPGGRDETKVLQLKAAFLANGFSNDHPALVGYPLFGKIQLLTGTHRHEAAKRAKILLPTILVLRSDVELYWGTDKWPALIADIPVRDLVYGIVAESPPNIDLFESLLKRVQFTDRE